MLRQRANVNDTQMNKISDQMNMLNSRRWNIPNPKRQH